MTRPLYISKPILPDLDDLSHSLREIWESKIVTNGGNFHNKLENELAVYLGVPTAKLFNNGTIGLLAALKFFDFPKGSEIITTPLTFAATAHAITWNGFKPIFVDVDPQTLTIDPDSIQSAINKKTAAILAVHVYGKVCDVYRLKEIATKNNLKLIYDSAHVFGTEIDSIPISMFGDMNIFSFHATKLFNTIEGGMITSPNENDGEKIASLRNFGIKNEDEVVSVGINGKMNEIQAAIGLLNLKLIEQEKKCRDKIKQRYDEFFESIKGIRLLSKQENVKQSQQYYPIVIDKSVFGRSRDDIYNTLREKGIFSRKYFHPICTDFLPYKNDSIISVRENPYVEVVKNQVLCLPFHSEVDDDDVSDIFFAFTIK